MTVTDDRAAVEFRQSIDMDTELERLLERREQMGVQIRELLKEMPERIGAVGVTVCGPGAFSDSVRKAVREVIDEGSVDFIEEAFSY